MDTGSQVETLQAAGRIAGVGKGTMLKWARRAKLGEQIGGRWFIDRAKLDAFLAARAVVNGDA